MKILVIMMTASLASLPGARTSAQQPAASAVADSAGVTGKYDLSFVPKNGEGITAQLVITRRGEKYRGVITSPKLSEPADADAVEVNGHHVRVTALDGAYVFDFDVDGTTISRATYAKSMNGVTDEGNLVIRRRSSDQ